MSFLFAVCRFISMEKVRCRRNVNMSNVWHICFCVRSKQNWNVYDVDSCEHVSNSIFYAKYFASVSILFLLFLCSCYFALTSCQFILIFRNDNKVEKFGWRESSFGKNRFRCCWPIFLWSFNRYSNLYKRVECWAGSCDW